MPSVIFFVLSAAAPLTVVAGVVTTGYARHRRDRHPAGLPAGRRGARALLGRLRGDVPPGGERRRLLRLRLPWPRPTGRRRRRLGRADRVQRAPGRAVRHHRRGGRAGARPALRRAPALGRRGPGGVGVGRLARPAAGGHQRHGPGGAAGRRDRGGPRVRPGSARQPGRAARSASPRLARTTCFVPGGGAVLVLAILGFVGFESAVVFSEESKDPKRTVPLATYLSVAIIAGLYALSSWTMTVAVGPEQIVRRGRRAERRADLQPGRRAPRRHRGHHRAGALPDLGAGRDDLVPQHHGPLRLRARVGSGCCRRCSGGPRPRTGAPRVASVAQSVLGLLVILLYAVNGWDPVVQLFFWVGTAGGFGVLLLIATTSVAVIAYFARSGAGENLWRRADRPGAGHRRAGRDHPVGRGRTSPTCSASRRTPRCAGRSRRCTRWPRCWASSGRWCCAASRPDTYARIGLRRGERGRLTSSRRRRPVLEVTR